MSTKRTFALTTGLLFCLSVGCVPNIPNGNDNDNDNVSEPAPTLFTRASTCGFCHNGLTDEDDNNVSIETDWKATMMANAARDPYFLAKVAAEIERAPALKEVIEDTCSTCHMPMARTQAAADDSSTAMFDDGFLNVDNELHAEALDGVSCTVCHQVEDVGLGEQAGFSGKFTIDLETEIPNRVTYGPYSNPDQEAMQASSGFIPVLGEHIQEAALCAVCHTLFTPFVDAEGTVLGQFPEQVAFLEWMHSDFGDGAGEDRTCQNCHMPDAAGGVVIAVAPSGLDARTPFAQHHFVGGNTFMVQMLEDHADELDVEASAGNFDTVVSRAFAQLQNDAAELTIVDARAEGDALLIDVRVQNKAGHKFPTGFPARRVWIHLTVTDASEAIIFESGAPQIDGSITGNDSDQDIRTFEPHYTTITEANQVQIYQSVMENSDGEVTHALLRAAAYAKDNRLLPAGFDKATAGTDFATVGQAFDDVDFVGGSDEITYSVDIGDHEGPFTISAALLYQSVALPFVEDLREELSSLTTRFVDYFDDADKAPVVVDSAESVVVAR